MSNAVTCVGVSASDWAAALAGTPSGARSPHPDFSCFLIRSDVWRKMGPFDESYLGAFYEDNDYHVRMHRAGVDAYSLDVPYLHHASLTIKMASRLERAELERKATANRERFKQRYGCYPGTGEYDKSSEKERGSQATCP